MAGMKAGLYFPSWPDMNGSFIPEVLQNSSNWTWLNLTNYDTYIFAPALIQFIHRLLAYVLIIFLGYTYFKYNNTISKLSKKWLNTIAILIVLQLTLGVLTVLNVKIGIPLIYGVLHQLVGMLFFISLLFFYFSLREKRQF